MKYSDFIAGKLASQQSSGFVVSKSQLHPHLLPHQRDLVQIALKVGRYCIWADTGLGKAFMGLEWASHVVHETGMPVLIVAPLGVAHQIAEVEAPKFGYRAIFLESHDKPNESGINVTNYEKLENFDLSVFSGVVLDESSILKSKDGKTRKFIIEAFSQTPYKLACSATPSPNDHMELGSQCEFVGALSMNEMLAEYFVHDGGSTQKWRLKKHAKNRFWEFVSSWASYISNPAQMGYDGSAYELPSIQYHEHLVGEWDDLAGNGELLRHQAVGLNEQRQVRKKSLIERCSKALEIVESNPHTPWLIWCETNDESKWIADNIPGIVEVKGADSDRHKKDALLGFACGNIQRLVTKPKIAGFGMNWQRCHNVIYIGLSHSFEQYYQSVRRVYRFGQDHPVNVHIIQHVLEGAIIANIKRKEKQASELTNQLSRKLMIEKSGEFIRTEYNPGVKMQLPSFLRSCA